MKRVIIVGLLATFGVLAVAETSEAGLFRRRRSNGYGNNCQSCNTCNSCNVQGTYSHDPSLPPPDAPGPNQGTYAPNARGNTTYYRGNNMQPRQAPTAQPSRIEGDAQFNGNLNRNQGNAALRANANAPAAPTAPSGRVSGGVNAETND